MPPEPCILSFSNLEKNMTVTGNGVHQRGRGYMETEALKFSEKSKKRKTTCISRGLKKKGKINSWKTVYTFKIVELKYTIKCIYICITAWIVHQPLWILITWETKELIFFCFVYCFSAPLWVIFLVSNLHWHLYQKACDLTW